MAMREKRYAYVAGSAAEQLEGNYSNFKSNRMHVVENKKQKTAIRQNQSNPVYSIVLTMVIVMTLAIAVILLKTQFVVTDRGETIIALKQELVDLNKKNDQLKSDINQSINMDNVYRVATQKLGMVQAGKNDIIYIDQETQSYTIQYAKVAQETADTGISLGSFLGFISQGW